MSDSQTQKENSPADNKTKASVPQIRQGSRPGDRYIRLGNFGSSASKTSADYEQPTAIDAPDSCEVIAWNVPARLTGWRKVKQFLVGQPIATANSDEERLSKLKGLAVLSSDALSSVAYATEAALFVLVLGFQRESPTGWIVPISIAICLLTAIVSWSYRQTIFAYPTGGGSYIVAKDNLGETTGLLAGAALMIDYVLTVAVSVASGTANFASAFPAIQPYAVPIMVGLVLLLVLGNLRGVRESGAIFAVPVYFFIISFLALLGVGLYQVIFTNHPLIQPPPGVKDIIGFNTEAVSLILILQAFAGGCTAMTGIEAISNGVPAFKKPVSKNAATTLIWMAAILIVFFMGSSILADQFQAQPSEKETIISQLSRVIFGDASVGYFIVQLATTLILILAANTGFADFPRLAALLGRDKFLPHIFEHRGDRLAFSTGIVALGGLAIVLLIIFQGSVQALIPLFAVGVFLAFTLSQAGMVVHWQKEKQRYPNRAREFSRSQLINGLGAVSTGIALVVIAVGKFLAGAWLVILLLPLLFFIFKAIQHHYLEVADQISLQTPSPRLTTLSIPAPAVSADQPLPGFEVIVPVADLNRVSLSTLNFARSLSQRVTAVFVSDDTEAINRLRERWDTMHPGVPLVVLETAYRTVTRPLVTYLEQIHKRNQSELVLVVLPEFVVRRWWEQLLHNQSALRLKAALLYSPGVVVLSVPYQLERTNPKTKK